MTCCLTSCFPMFSGQLVGAREAYTLLPQSWVFPAGAAVPPDPPAKRPSARPKKHQKSTQKSSTKIDQKISKKSDQKLEAKHTQGGAGAKRPRHLGAPPKAALFASNFWSDFWLIFLTIFLMIFGSIFGAFFIGPKAFLPGGPGGRQPPRENTELTKF